MKIIIDVDGDFDEIKEYIDLITIDKEFINSIKFVK